LNKNVSGFWLTKSMQAETTIDNEWLDYLLQHNYETTRGASFAFKDTYRPADEVPARIPPPCEELNISTHTKTLYLNQIISPKEIFWKIPIIEYGLPMEGVVYKDMKIVMNTPEELQEYQEHLSRLSSYHREIVLRQINVLHSKRHKFKDERKIIIGINKKNILNSRKRQKGAFMNCFTMTVRFFFEESFREIHIKIFKTGNVEIPGILNGDLLTITKRVLIDTLQPLINVPLSFVENAEKHKSVLINSDFRCGYFIERDLAYSILKNKYNMDVSYDPCSYPGVKCKFYFNHEYQYNTDLQRGQISSEDYKLTVSQLGKHDKYTCVTFTLFRTGSCLISGNCSEDVLYYIYGFVRQFLQDEYNNICIHQDLPVNKKKKTIVRRQTIHVSFDYYDGLMSNAPTREISDNFHFMR